LGILLPCTGESESVIMIGVADRRDEWVGPSSRPERLRASLRLVWQNLQLERNGALFGVHGLVRPKVLDRGRHCQRRDLSPTTASHLRLSERSFGCRVKGTDAKRTDTCLTITFVLASCVVSLLLLAPDSYD